MTEEHSVPSSDNDAIKPAQEGDTSEKKQEHMIPKARLDEEIKKRRDVEESLSHMAEAVIASVPEKFRSLVPEGSPAQQAAWVFKARESGLFEQSREVPATDKGKPKNEPVVTDYNSMNPTQRIAAVFNRK